MYDSRPKQETRRRPARSGEAHHAARLTVRQVLLIRKQADRARLRGAPVRGRRGRPCLWPRGFIRNLAAVYGVSVNTIYDIISRRKWRNV